MLSVGPSYIQCNNLWSGPKEKYVSYRWDFPLTISHRKFYSHNHYWLCTSPDTLALKIQPSFASCMNIFFHLLSVKLCVFMYSESSAIPESQHLNAWVVGRIHHTTLDGALHWAPPSPVFGARTLEWRQHFSILQRYSLPLFFFFFNHLLFSAFWRRTLNPLHLKVIIDTAAFSQSFGADLDFFFLCTFWLICFPTKSSCVTIGTQSPSTSLQLRSSLSIHQL